MATFPVTHPRTVVEGVVGEAPISQALCCVPLVPEVPHLCVCVWQAGESDATRTWIMQLEGGVQAGRSDTARVEQV
jgi:hypothetical protein